MNPQPSSTTTDSTPLPPHIDLLRKTPLSTVLISKPLTHRTLHSLLPHSTVDDALHLFSTHRINAAPIIDDSRPGRARYLGVLSLFDLLIPITSDPTLRTLNILPAEERAHYLASHPPAVYSSPILPYLGMSSESAYAYQYSSSQPLADIMEVLSHGVHRVLVFDKGGHVRGGAHTEGNDERCFMLTQMDVARYLVEHIEALGPVASKSLIDLRLASEDAAFEHFHRGGTERNIDHAYEAIPSSSSGSHAIPSPTPPPPPPPVQRRPSITEQLRYLLPSSSALSGFSSMHPPSVGAASVGSGDVTALPIVDPHNFALQSTLSVSDLRSVTSDRAALLGLPVLDFLRELWLLGAMAAGEGKAKKREEEQRVPYIFQVVTQAESTLGRVMKDMVEDEVHRSWVVDELGRVVGVVTLTDVIGKLSPFDREREQRSRGEEEKMSERKGQ